MLTVMTFLANPKYIELVPMLINIVKDFNIIYLNIYIKLIKCNSNRIPFWNISMSGAAISNLKTST